MFSASRLPAQPLPSGAATSPERFHDAFPLQLSENLAAGDLGAVPLGPGSRPRLGSHPARVRQYLDQSVADADAGLHQATPPQATEKTDTVRELLGEIPLRYP